MKAHIFNASMNNPVFHIRISELSWITINGDMRLDDYLVIEAIGMIVYKS